VGIYNSSNDKDVYAAAYTHFFDTTNNEEKIFYPMIYFNAVDPAKVTFSADDKELKKKFETNDKTQLIQLLRVAEYSATTFTGKNDVTFTVAYSTRKYI